MDCEGEDDELDFGDITDNVGAHGSDDVAISTEAAIRLDYIVDRPAFLGVLQLPDRSMGRVEICQPKGGKSGAAHRAVA